jgi:hypothetical protein
LADLWSEDTSGFWFAAIVSALVVVVTLDRSLGEFSIDQVAAVLVASVFLFELFDVILWSVDTSLFRNASVDSARVVVSAADRSESAVSALWLTNVRCAFVVVVADLSGVFAFSSCRIASVNSAWISIVTVLGVCVWSILWAAS